MIDPVSAVVETVLLAEALPPSLPPLSKPVQYVVAANGIFKRAANRCLEAVAVVTKFDELLPGLHPLRPYARWLPGTRLPEDWLQFMLDAARRPPEKEILFHIHHRADGGFLLVRPPQSRGITSVRPLAPPPPDVVLVCDVHSHHRLPTGFSRIDDADDQALRFYAVFGWSTGQPTIRLRAGVYGYFVPVPLTTVFSGCGPFEDLCDAPDYV